MEHNPPDVLATAKRLNKQSFKKQDAANEEQTERGKGGWDEERERNGIRLAVYLPTEGQLSPS